MKPSFSNPCSFYCNLLGKHPEKNASFIPQYRKAEMKGTKYLKKCIWTILTVAAAYRQNGLEFIKILLWGYI